MNTKQTAPFAPMPQSRLDAALVLLRARLALRKTGARVIAPGLTPRTDAMDVPKPRRRWRHRPLHTSLAIDQPAPTRNGGTPLARVPEARLYEECVAEQSFRLSLRGRDGVNRRRRSSAILEA